MTYQLPVHHEEVDILLAAVLLVCEVMNQRERHFEVTKKIPVPRDPETDMLANLMLCNPGWAQNPPYGRMMIDVPLG
jgi:hypothetical protein